jgi:hypothetical protein
MRALALLPLLAACNGGEDSDTAPVCDAAVLSFAPEDGTGPYALDKPLVFTIEGTASEATVTVTGPDGAEIAGEVTIGEGTVTWEPADELPEEATVSWTAQICDVTGAGTFTTGTLGSDVPPEELSDDTFAVDLANATWVQPEGGEDLVEQFFAGAFLIGIQAVTEITLDTIGASGEATASGSWQQDPCYATIDFEPVDFTTNPYFVLETDEMRFTVQGIEAIIYDVQITGGLTNDAIVDGTFQGEIDMDDYKDDLGTSDPCGMLAMYAGLECVACSWDGEEHCLFLMAEDVEGEEVPGLQLVPNDTPQECNEDTGGGA